MSDNYIFAPHILRISDGKSAGAVDQRMIYAELDKASGLNMHDLVEINDEQVEELFSAARQVSFRWPRYYFEFICENSDGDEAKWTTWVYLGKSEEKYIKVIYPKMSRAAIKRMAR